MEKFINSNYILKRSSVNVVDMHPHICTVYYVDSINAVFNIM